MVTKKFEGHLGGSLMNIESLTNEIMERFNYYEKRRFGHVEANCLNLETKYDNNDNTAQGFFVAIRKQEPWNGENFREIAKKLLAQKDSKILRYLIIRSIDCDLEMLEEVFEPKRYSNGELQEIARVANSNKILEMIFDYVYHNVGRVEGYFILCCMANNKVASKELFDKLYVFDKRLSAQIFLNIGCQASTELLMKMFYECDDILKELHIMQLVQFNRAEIDKQLKHYLLRRLIITLQIKEKEKQLE